MPSHENYILSPQFPQVQNEGTDVDTSPGIF